MGGLVIWSCKTCGKEIGRAAFAATFKGLPYCKQCLTNMQSNEKEKVMQSENTFLNAVGIRLEEMNARIAQLEKHIHYPAHMATTQDVAMKEAAARAQSMQDMDISKLTVDSDIFKYAVKGTVTADHVPMRTDVETIRTLTAFAKRLLNTEDFGHAVTFEVRQAARRALGLPEVKEYDL